MDDEVQRETGIPYAMADTRNYGWRGTGNHPAEQRFERAQGARCRTRDCF